MIQASASHSAFIAIPLLGHFLLPIPNGIIHFPSSNLSGANTSGASQIVGFLWIEYAFTRRMVPGGTREPTTKHLPEDSCGSSRGAAGYIRSILNDAVEVGKVPQDSINPFVKQAVQYAIAAFKVILSEKEKLQKLLLQGLDITILGSNDFYSCRDQGCCVEYITLVGDNLASIFPDASLNPLLCGIPQPLLFFPLFGSRTLAYYPTSQVTLLFGSRTLA
ncbi:hypothetical protein ZIOFF_026513 [Zingiber officinale]|uniref:Uncharacterized protein n=1 Tax=Zingiber officinale TaxID=94328 RepID=A0A8J5HGQ1_ZINOF|nr:hypothetical protein ZIOFF_026513 [Zingiber officinale]